MNLRRCEIGDTGDLMTRTAQGRSDGRRVLDPDIQVPGVAVYDSGAVLFIPLSAIFAFGDKTRCDAAAEIDSLAAPSTASSTRINSAFAFSSEGLAFLRLKAKGLGICGSRKRPELTR